MSKLPAVTMPDLGGYLREQRHSAELSLRQLADVAGISNPYLSQIERGLKKPSAEILQALAKALRISAESLYVRAGFLDEAVPNGAVGVPDVTAAILADPRLSSRQRRVLLDVYESFVGELASHEPAEQPRAATSKPATAASPSASGPQKPKK
jgi:transcriptional regulator with XRE-family HTH domain